MSGINRSALEIIGNTPLVELCNIEKKYHLQARILAKLEFFNPAGSAKDRIAKEMVEDAERRGILKQGATLIEPTSGNTGIGLAAVAAVKGYRAIFVMPETMSAERINILRAYGAEIVLTEGIKGMAGSIEKAESLAREIPNSFIPAQFDNPANAIAHEKTTGPEIWKDTEGKVDAFVAVEPASSHCCQKERVARIKYKESVPILYQKFWIKMYMIKYLQFRMKMH